MKKVSYWAKNHKVEARVILVIAYTILNILAITTGSLLQRNGFLLSPVFLFCCFTVAMITTLVYPSKYLKGIHFSSSAFYNLQKTCDFIIVSCTLCMFVYLSNRPGTLLRFYSQSLASVIIPTPKDKVDKPYKSISDFYTSLKDKDGNLLKWKERKKLLKEQVKSIKKDNNLSKGKKTTLIILSVLVALGLFALVLSLACDLSCSGSDAAAAIVGIGGTALIIFLLILVIRAINGKKRKRKIKSENPSTTP
jgi:hypothetical protein